MKRIKPVVLKDATKLTNREMKKIRGGITGEPPPSTTCSVACPTSAVIPEVTAVCPVGYYCDVVSGAGGMIGAGCYNNDTGELYIDQYTPVEYCESIIE